MSAMGQSGPTPDMRENLILTTSPCRREWLKAQTAAYNRPGAKLLINFKTAKALGLTFLPSFLATSDEVIE
jgi:hypothetical protein